MRVVNEIFHAIYERKEGRICWRIHVATEARGEILKIVASLNSCVHEATNPVIEGSPMWVFNFFRLFYNNRCIHEE